MFFQVGAPTFDLFESFPSGLRRRMLIFGLLFVRNRISNSFALGKRIGIMRPRSGC